MREAFQRLLEQVILPQYDSIKSVDVSYFTLHGGWMKVTYYYTPPFDKNFYKVTEETASLFQMLGPEKGDDFTIDFKVIEEED